MRFPSKNAVKCQYYCPLFLKRDDLQVESMEISKLLIKNISGNNWPFYNNIITIFFNLILFYFTSAVE